jgi:hypothetical protein
MQKQIIQASINRKTKQIKVLRLILRAIKKLQEQKNSKYESKQLKNIEIKIN